MAGQDLNKTYLIYARDKGHGAFRALDLAEGCYAGNLIYASRVASGQIEGLLTQLQEENPDMEFQAREAK